MSEPLLAPVPEAEWDDETRDLLGRNAIGSAKVLDIFATLAHHPKLLKRWMVFGAHVLAKSTLPERDRELLILRTGWNCRSPYEWGQHVEIGRRLLTDDEITRVTEGPGAEGWAAFDALLLRAADELHADACVSEPTWHALAERYSTEQLLDLVFCVGQYHVVAMAANSCRITRDDGASGVPMPDRY